MTLMCGAELYILQNPPPPSPILSFSVFILSPLPFVVPLVNDTTFCTELYRKKFSAYRLFFSPHLPFSASEFPFRALEMFQKKKKIVQNFYYF